MIYGLRFVNREVPEEHGTLSVTRKILQILQMKILKNEGMYYKFPEMSGGPIYEWVDVPLEEEKNENDSSKLLY